MKILNITGYRFFEIQQPEALANALLQRCQELEIKGTILIASEGINLSISADESSIVAFLDSLRKNSVPSFPLKKSYSKSQSHRRMLVRVKDEIVTMRCDSVNPRTGPAPYISPEELREWLRSEKDFILLDTRKNFEFKMGSFKGARPIGVDHFSDFPRKARELLPEIGSKPVVTFCTGGIRCEKGAPAMLLEGYPEVYQLEGGLFNYFEKCGGEFFEGNCFVFDRRVAIRPDLEPVSSLDCTSCGAVISINQEGSQANHHLCDSCLPVRSAEIRHLGSSAPSLHAGVDTKNP